MYGKFIDLIQCISKIVQQNSVGKNYILEILNDKNKLKEIINLKKNKTITFRLKDGTEINISNAYR